MERAKNAPEDATWTAVVWNLNEARGAKRQSWAVLEGFYADVALLSEARVPEGIIAIGHGKTIGRDCKHEREEDCRGRPWSTAIVSRHAARPITHATARRYGRPLDIPFSPSRPGTWIAASVSIPQVGEVSMVSLYGLTDEKSDASVHRSLSDLEPLFEDPEYNARLLLGGDLNILANPRPDDPARDSYRLVLERIKAYGLVDLFERDAELRDSPRQPPAHCPCGNTDCTHVWTFRSRRETLAHIPYQDDHVFVSQALADQLKSCEAGAFNAASDHAPILATFWI
jgi:exonuclease III